MSAAPATATPTDLSQLENAGEFIARHIGVTPDEERQMLAVIGEPSRQALIDAIVPRSIARSDDMALPPVASEAAALAELKVFAGQNRLDDFFGVHVADIKVELRVLLMEVLEQRWQ